MPATKKTKSKKNLNVKDYERLGRTFESIFEGGYINHSRVYKINFIRGLFFGLGTALGGTIVLASLIWILTLFTELPLVGELADVIRDTID